MNDHQKYSEYQRDKEEHDARYEAQYGAPIKCDNPNYSEGIRRDCYKCNLPIMFCANCARDHHV